MNLINRFRQRAAGVHTEFLTNLEEVDHCGFVNGLVKQENTGGCRLSSAPTEASNMDSETKDLMKGILNKLEDPAIQQAIRERLVPKAKAAPPPQKTAQQKAEDEAARDALLQYARNVAECADFEQDMAKRTGFKLVGGGI